MSGRPTRTRPAPTLAETVAQIARDLASVDGQTRELRAFLMGARPVSREQDVVGRPDSARGDTGGTLEPKDELRAALEETEGQHDEAAQMRVIRGIAAGLQGTLADLRAIRSMIGDTDVLDRVRQRTRKKPR